MNHLLLFVFCILAFEVLKRLHFIDQIKQMVNIFYKVIGIIRNKRISDHWKEIIVPNYALSMMKYSLFIILQLLLLVVIFILISLISNDLITYAVSVYGIIESIAFISILLAFKKYSPRNE